MNAARRFLRSFQPLFSAALFLLLLYTMLRLLFWWYNRTLFPGIRFSEAGAIFFRGVQQDLVTIILSNAPVLLLCLIASYTKVLSARTRPHRPAHTGSTILYRIAFWVFIMANAAGIAFNLLDTGYFRFNHHRSSRDLLYVFKDSLGSFKSLLAGYWFLLLLFIGGVLILTRIARYLFAAGSSSSASVDPASPLRRSKIPGLLLRHLLLLLLLVGIVGALPGTFVLPSTPLLSVEPGHLPLAQNSAFTFSYSLIRRQQEMKPAAYFPAEELARITSTTHTMGKNTDTLQKKNVVICILESFSRSYLLPGDKARAITPFFDSLIGKSIFFPHSVANGFQSNEGIVSILGGLPPFLDEPFFYSLYANTPLKSIGNILKENGYNTNFFMGAGKDHFGFGKFAKMAGIDHYFSREDFNDDRYYDGNWGIFDEPFLQFGAGVLAAKQTPFLAVFFTISSHPPYTIPPQYRDRFDIPGKTAPQRSISYVDYSFQRFFASCSKMPWFRNTLFVFCADHWLDPYEGRTVINPVNSSAIPIFIYDPSRDSGTVSDPLASQVDLTPTILGLLHYKGSYTGFGRDLLDTARSSGITGNAPGEHYALNRIGEVYQVITGDMVLGYDRSQEKSRYLYRYSGLNITSENLIGDSAYKDSRDRMERWVKASIQAYYQGMTRRSLE